MRRPATRFTVVASALLASLACGRGTTPASSGIAAASAIPATPPVALKTESEIRDLDIAYYEARAERDPTGAMDLAHVAALLLERSRESGDPRDAQAAEQAARRSIANRGARNAQARQVLVAALLSQHSFAEALTVARALRDDAPDVASLQATVGEIEMELGQYDSARVTFAAIHPAAGDLSVIPRLARWAEIEGRPQQALRMQRASLAVALREPTIPREQVAWFWLRVGDVELRTGHPLAADSSYARGLALHPHDYRLLSALARSASLQGRWQQAIAYGEDAIASTLDPVTLGTLSDSWAALGDTAKAAEYAHVLDVAVLRQPGAYHRAWSLFLLDHHRHIATVTAKVREELRTRRDIYGYDLLAWALHAQGRDAEAAAPMATALAQGTRDAQLLFHAGMIERALGRDDAARRHLAEALAVNPYFHPTQPAEARAALAALGTTSDPHGERAPDAVAPTTVPTPRRAITAAR